MKLFTIFLDLLKSTDMNEYKLHEYWKSLICIMTIRYFHSNSANMRSAECLLNIVKTKSR